jgi:hypothetical protein
MPSKLRAIADVVVKEVIWTLVVIVITLTFVAWLEDHGLLH